MSFRHRRRSPHWVFVVLGLFLMTAGCGLINELLPTSSTSEEEDSEPSSETSSSSSSSGSSPSTPTTYPAPTTGVKAPEIQSPAQGDETTDTTPMLVVSNAVTQDKAPVYYTFELSGDEGFTEMIAEAEGIPQGESTSTSWQVPDALSDGSYFWRARGQSGYVKSPYSDVAAFKVIQAQVTPAPTPTPTPTPGGGVASVIDPLTDGTSVGDVHGGKFTSQGWKVTNQSNFIRYEIQPLESGFVEWENQGFRPSNPAINQYMLFGMWDPTRGDYRTNPYRVHIQKLDDHHNQPYVRLRWIAGGEQHDAGYQFEDWDPEQVYLWRLEWGPADGANEARVFLNGNLIIEITYRRRYSPDVHLVELGISERVESIVGTIYANVRIGSR